MAAPRPLPEAPFLQPPASRGRLGWAFGVSSRFPVRSLLHRATTPSVSVVTFGGGGSGPRQRVSRDRVGLGVGPCTGKGRGGVPTRAPPLRLPFVVGESCPWPRPRLGLIPPPSQGRRSVRQMPSEGTDECHAQTAVRAGDPSRPLRLGHWGHWVQTQFLAIHPGSSECPDASRPRAGPQADLLSLVGLGWEVQLLAMFGVPGTPHHSTVPSALPAGWRPHPFS